jgi:hypothetical protein
VGAFDWALEEIQAPAEPGNQEAVERMHRLFKQNPEGALILNAWIRMYLFTPPAHDLTPYQCGVRDGRAEFVKTIVLMCNQLENDIV